MASIYDDLANAQARFDRIIEQATAIVEGDSGQAVTLPDGEEINTFRESLRQLGLAADAVLINVNDSASEVYQQAQQVAAFVDQAQGALEGTQTNAERAEAALAAALVNGRYRTVDVGLANTVSGDVFAVVGEQFYVAYENDSGVATPLALVSTDGAQRELSLRGIQPGYTPAGSQYGGGWGFFADAAVSNGIVSEAYVRILNPGDVTFMVATLNASNQMEIVSVSDHSFASAGVKTISDLGLRIRQGQYFGWAPHAVGVMAALGGGAAAVPVLNDSNRRAGLGADVGDVVGYQYLSYSDNITYEVGAQIIYETTVSETVDRQISRRVAPQATAPTTAQLPAFGEHTAQTTQILGNRALRQSFPTNECLLSDTFLSEAGTPVGSGSAVDHTPGFRAPDLGNYIRLGNNAWEVRSTEMVATTAVDAVQGSDTANASGVGVTLPIGWYGRMMGVEVRARIVAPTDRECGLYFVIPEGIVLLRLVDGGESRITLYYNDGGPRALAFVEDSYPRGQEIEFVLRVYRPNLIIATINGRPIAHIDYDTDDRRRFDTVSDVGVYYGRKTTVPDIAVREFTVSPVPAAGSSAYRAKPPEPAPVVPPLVKHGVIFNGDAIQVPDDNEFLNFSVIPMHRYAAALGITPIDNYYCWYSTDHSSGAGGVYLMTAPNPEGPWTQRPGSGPDGQNYLFTGVGDQTESPCVQYDEDNNRLVMIFSQRGGGPANGAQYSHISVSTDGENWTHLKAMQDVPTRLRNTYLRHDGYCSFTTRDPLGINPGWHAWPRIYPEGDKSLWGYSHSPDGEHWTPDLLPIRIPSITWPNRPPEIVDGMGGGSIPFAYAGQRLFVIAPFKANGVGNNQGYLAIVRMGDDMRNLSAAEHVIEKTLPEEGNSAHIGTVMVEDNTLYLYYVYDRRNALLITADLTAPPTGSRPF